MDVMKKIKFLLILFWNKCSFLHYDRKLLLKLSKCNFLNVSGICNFYTCKKLLYWKQSSIVRHFCPTSPMDPIFHIWAVVTCTKAWGKNQGDKWLFTNCQKNEPNLMLGLLSKLCSKKSCMEMERITPKSDFGAILAEGQVKFRWSLTSRLGKV